MTENTPAEPVVIWDLDSGQPIPTLRLPDTPPLGPEATKELQQQLGLPNIEQLLVLARYRDPFYTGSPTQQRWAEWFADVWQTFGERGHLRRVHYRLLGSDTPHPRGDQPYVNSKQHWQDLQGASRFARLLGLIDPEQLDDRRNAAALEYARARLEDPTLGWTWTNDPELPVWRMPGDPGRLWLPTVSGTLPWIGSGDDDDWGLWRLPRPGVEPVGYEYAPTDQPVLLEVWVEKSTVNDVLEPACASLGVNLVAGLGFESYTRVIELLRRAEAHHAHRAHVLYVSDCDRSGNRMPRTVGRQADYFARQLGIDVQLSIERVALTREQVAEYELPEDPTEGGRVELDALQALRPGELRRLVLPCCRATAGPHPGRPTPRNRRSGAHRDSGAVGRPGGRRRGGAGCSGGRRPAGP
jgi:hypothetical protein